MEWRTDGMTERKDGIHTGEYSKIRNVRNTLKRRIHSTPIMYRSNRSFNMPPPGQPPGHLTFLKIVVQIPPYPGQNAVQIPHTGVHSGDQMPPPRGHFTGTKMTEGRWKRLQLSNKIFINRTNTEKHC